MTPVLAMRGVTALIMLLFALLTAPAMLSAVSTAMVWAGIATILVCVVGAAAILTTPVLDGYFAKIEAAFMGKDY